MSGSNASAAESTSDETAAKVHKRYEGLVMVRTRAIKGKGAWYWAHLEPILVHHSDSGVPKAVKLKCTLCAAVFSASNPSRTASEHLKRGTCPNITALPTPISSVPSSSSFSAAPSPYRHRKRGGRRRNGDNPDPTGTTTTTTATTSFSSHHVVQPLSIVEPSRFPVDLSSPPTVSVGGGGCGFYGHHHRPPSQLMLSGGKEDLGPLAQLEDSVKRLKSPKPSPRPPPLTKPQIDSALNFLADWAYDCCGSISISVLDHPKFKSFLNHVGLPPIPRGEFLGPRLDAKYAAAKADSDAKIRDAMFFQISSDGWKSSKHHGDGDGGCVNLSVNLPNGATVFRKAVFTNGYATSKLAEELLSETISEISGGNLQQCAGVVSDKFNSTALKNLENLHHWMVNLSCQRRGFAALIKDFGKELQLFRTAADNCLKLATFVNNHPQIRRTFYKYQMQEYGHGRLLRADAPFQTSDFSIVDDVLACARALQLVLLDESYKAVSKEETVAKELEEMMRNPCFWNELEAVHSLVKLVKTTAQDVEIEKPRIGRCLPLWDEMRTKTKDWCSKFGIPEPSVEKVLDKRFAKNYHPAWAAAFILDPLYLIRDSSGKYLPPFKCLTTEQEKDVDKLITRLVSKDEAHIALMELMKWRTEGLDPVYAQAVQLKQQDPSTGKMKVANSQSSRLVWETYLTEFKLLAKVAVRLIFLHATSCGFKCDGSVARWIGGSRLGRDRAQKLLFVYAHSKTEKREVSSDGDKDNGGELFALPNGEDDVLNEVFVDASSVSIEEF
ncbi:uncharacterized protein LOC127243488 isoform X2 [Andrographis paniculata]|uniref:uncharacterized protein LOC127243488 isoform X2 n=1 Tax=Andrographis paniculata TaxID=175694 RepID=UPI0021E86879|nr:uncharacterized protein LOC127243488 isoform X2 [Andrographis paniculata]